MNLQTLKPRARITHSYGKPVWRVTFPDSPTGFISRTLDGAVAVAYRCRLARLIGNKDA